QPDGVRHSRPAPLLLRVVIGQASLLLDSPRAAGAQGDDRPERQLLQVVRGVIGNDHLCLTGLGIDLSSSRVPSWGTATYRGAVIAVPPTTRVLSPYWPIGWVVAAEAVRVD